MKEEWEERKRRSLVDAVRYPSTVRTSVTKAISCTSSIENLWLGLTVAGDFHEEVGSWQMEMEILVNNFPKMD